MIMNPSMQNQTLLSKHIGLLAFLSLFVFIIWSILWESILAPIRPGGSWLVLKIIPLTFVLPGVYKQNRYTLQCSLMLIIFYTAEALVRAVTEQGNTRLVASVAVMLGLLHFIASVLYLHPYKKAARNHQTK